MRPEHRRYFYRNVFNHVPRGNFRAVARTLKAIHTSEDLVAVRDKAKMVVTKLKELRLTKATGARGKTYRRDARLLPVSDAALAAYPDQQSAGTRLLTTASYS